MEIIIKVREKRKEQRLSIRQLAQESGISKSQIAAIETGSSIPTILTLCRLAEAMRVKPEELYEYW